MCYAVFLWWQATISLPTGLQTGLPLTMLMACACVSVRVHAYASVSVFVRSRTSSVEVEAAGISSDAGKQHTLKAAFQAEGLEMPLWVNPAIISSHAGSRIHDARFSGLRFISQGRGLARHCAESMSWRLVWYIFQVLGQQIKILHFLGRLWRNIWLKNAAVLDCW